MVNVGVYASNKKNEYLQQKPIEHYSQNKINFNIMAVSFTFSSEKKNNVKEAPLLDLRTHLMFLKTVEHGIWE